MSRPFSAFVALGFLAWLVLLAAGAPVLYHLIALIALTVALVLAREFEADR